MALASIFIAYILDLCIGDPKRRTHPVIIIGNLISLCEKSLLKEFDTPNAQKRKGIILAIFIPLTVFILINLIIYLATNIKPFIGFLMETWFIYIAIAGKELYYEGKTIYRFLDVRDLKNAQKRLKHIVSRDTETLSTEEIVKGTVETIAENAVDGVLGPLFFAFLGGAPFAMTYRAINTLDSMVGYKNEKYIYFGWGSAKLDDLVNLIPSRLCAYFMIFASFLLDFNYQNAYYIVKRDALKHSSPNSGYPESAVAGSLGIRLGGKNFYDGVPSFGPYIGEALKRLDSTCIIDTIRIVFATTLIFLVTGIFIKGWLIWAL
ncbi:MAG TPA: cobalamin biosynthesis protein CobD [Thermoanaerobacterales bacterium]|nr:cobalamin biosynthesis protein CobD [Thermoanaerobacterales bacterium]